MGILKDTAAMVKALELPEGFHVCELGNQMLSYTKPPAPAAVFYASIGCGRYESIDGNGRGTVTADLNLPLSGDLGTFDLVTDFGTGEHVFDQAQVWRTLHDLTKPGGYIAFDRPGQGYGKHCFYLADECLFRDIAEANRYGVRYFKGKETERGWLWRGVFQRPQARRRFVNPQQGRYQESLKIAGGRAH